MVLIFSGNDSITCFVASLFMSLFFLFKIVNKETIIRRNLRLPFAALQTFDGCIACLNLFWKVNGKHIEPVI